MIVVSWILLFSLFWLIAGSIVLVRNRYELTSLPALNKNESSTVSQPFVSLLIPARNEEERIEYTLRAACNQDYGHYEVIVLDDNSTDLTGSILQRLKQEYPDKLRILSGKAKPENWLGKPWACYQLAGHSEGDILLFIDADVQLQPEALAKAVYAMDSKQLDLLTVWPQQILKTFWEQAVIPVVYHTLVTLLPAIYVFRKPRWMPEFIYSKAGKNFAAGCGQFMMFRKKSYLKIGTHDSVKMNIVEDVELAKLAKSNGLTLRMFEGTGSVYCRMYHSEEDMRAGFRKNFFAGFNNSWIPFILFGFIHLAVYIGPFLLFPFALVLQHPLWLFLSALAISIILIQRLILALWFGWNPLYAFMHPVGVGWFQYLSFLVIFDRLAGRKTLWKGRPVT